MENSILTGIAKLRVFFERRTSSSTDEIYTGSVYIDRTVSGRVFLLVHDGHAVGSGRRRSGTGDSAHRAHARRPGPYAAVVRVRVIRHGRPSVGRRIVGSCTAATDRRRR